MLQASDLTKAYDGAPVFDGLSDDDLFAVIAYLRSVSALSRPSRPSELTLTGRLALALGHVKPRHDVISGVKSDEARAIVSAKPDAPSAAPSTERMILRSPNSARIAVSLASPCALVMTARAPELRSR